MKSMSLAVICTFCLSSSTLFAGGWTVYLGAFQPAHTHLNCLWECNQIGDECMEGSKPPNSPLEQPYGNYKQDTGWGNTNVFMVSNNSNSYLGCCQLKAEDCKVPPNKGRWSTVPNDH
jgi:hypothetical protein